MKRLAPVLLLVFLLFSILPAYGQSSTTMWEMFCPGNIEVLLQEGGNLVRCLDVEVIPTPTETMTPTTVPTETATITPTETSTPTATITSMPTITVTETMTPTETTIPTETATVTPTVTITPTETIPPTPTETATPQPVSGFIVDRTSVELFEQIPLEYLNAARNIDMMWSDRSVGDNINRTLDCFSAANYGSSYPSCRRYYADKSVVPWVRGLYLQSDWDNNNIPQLMRFDPSPVYDRSNWTFEFRQGTWSELTQDFIQVLAPQYISSKDVLSYQFSYLNIMEGDDIANPNSGFFSDNPDKYDVYDLENFIAQHPDKTFIFWTTSLSRDAGSSVSDAFNEQMRQYAIENDKILFDVADIESHNLEGAECYDNRDDVYWCGTNGCENYPDDGFNYLAICPDYTTEIGGGHLGGVSEGNIQIAKAYWVLMARIAGWNP